MPITYADPSSNRYGIAAAKATEEGLRPGSGSWWNRIRELMRQSSEE